MRAVRSSRRSGSVRCRVLRLERSEGRRADVARGRRVERLEDGERRFRRVERRRRVVFSLGESRRSWE